MSIFDTVGLAIGLNANTKETNDPPKKWFQTLLTGLKRGLDVPDKNGTANESISEVIGNREDFSFSSGQDNPTVVGHLKAGYYHVHSKARVYPPLADAKTLTTSAAGWTYGTKIEIIPVDTITTAFDIHWVVVSDISAVNEYELSLYSGAEGEETLMGTITFNRSSNFAQEGNLPIQVAPVSANTRVSAALACKSENACTCDVKLYYHTYPDI